MDRQKEVRKPGNLQFSDEERRKNYASYLFI